jgi:hypothetical protein
MDEGHCGLPTDQLIPLAEELLEAPKDLILTALQLERSEGAVIADKVGDTACIFLKGLYRAEQAIAERLIRIVSGRLPWPLIDEEKAVRWIEKRSGLQLADSQRAAIRLALIAKALVITGGPGVLCVVGVVILLQALPIAASIAGGAALYNPFPSMVTYAARDYRMRRALIHGRGGGGSGSGPALLPPPSSGGGQATITQGRNTISRGPGPGGFGGCYASPAAEQVAGALLASRVAQYRARNSNDASQNES